MNRSTRDWRILAPAVAALLLVACSSSNNNKKANSNSNTVAPATTVAAAGTATPAATAARPASPSPATPAARTATPAVAVTTAARTATPGARTATPLARPGSPTAGGGTADEKLLASIALTEADLPTGFSKQNDESTPPSVAGQTADYSATFTKLGQSASGLDVQAIVVGLAAFKDGPTATAGFKDLQKQVIEQSGGDFSLEPIANAPKIGDETLAFKVSGSAQGLTLGGYAIVWRRGRFGAAIIQVAVPTPATIDTAQGLAQKQDDKLKTAK